VPIAGRTASHSADPSVGAAARIHGGAVVSTEQRATVRAAAGVASTAPSAALSAPVRRRGVDDVDEADEADEDAAFAAGAEMRL
jgi:hypothetical protein